MSLVNSMLTTTLHSSAFISALVFFCLFFIFSDLLRKLDFDEIWNFRLHFTAFNVSECHEKCVCCYYNSPINHVDTIFKPLYNKISITIAPFFSYNNGTNNSINSHTQYTLHTFGNCAIAINNHSHFTTSFQSSLLQSR